MPTPIFFVTVNGVDVTDRFREHSISMTITDNEGLNADSLEIELDDKDGKIKLPKTGAVIEAVGGYEGNLRYFGRFVVDGITLNGYPQKMGISAKSIEAKSAAKQRDTVAYQTKDFPTYGDIFKKAASDLKLTLAISPALAAIPNPYEAQTEENQLEFLTRVAETIGAAVTIKAGRLIVVEKGAGKSASGKELEKRMVARGLNLVGYNVNISDEPQYSSVEAATYDRGGNKSDVAKTNTKMSGPVYRLRNHHHNKDAAKRAAEAKAKDLQAAQAAVTFEIDGDPWMMAEAWVTASGVREGIDGDWRVKTASHSFSADGPYTTSLQCDYPTGGA